MPATLKILTLADGFGDSWACPSWFPDFYKWPKILGLMTKNTEILDFCRYGAGNEYMVNCLQHNHAQANIVLAQWASPYRLDLLLDHAPDVIQEWRDEISHDQTYHDNFQTIGDKKWWISSASKTKSVIEYHRKYISRTQHQLRSRIWIEYAHKLLSNRTHGFLLTVDSAYLQGIAVNSENWVWHEPWGGMGTFRYHSRYRDLDLGITQPIPLIHFDFIEQFIMPKFDLNWRNQTEIKAVEQMLLRKYNQYKPNQQQ
jgi:hypothetical protein